MNLVKLTIMNSEMHKMYTILAFLSVMGLRYSLDPFLWIRVQMFKTNNVISYKTLNFQLYCMPKCRGCLPET